MLEGKGQAWENDSALGLKPVVERVPHAWNLLVEPEQLPEL
jgi:hypothetical protein